MDASADSKIAFFGPTEFVYDGDLPALDTPAGSWFFAPDQTPDLDRVAQLAAALGAEGDVRALPEDQGGGWAVGPEDYSGTVLTVGSDGMLSWWLSAMPTQTAPVASCGVGVGVGVATGSGVAVAGAVTGSSSTVDAPAATSAPAAGETDPAATPNKGAPISPSPSARRRSRRSVSRPRRRRWPRPSSCSAIGATTSARTSSTSRMPTSGVQA
jgi:hypothetical protein